MMRDRKSTKRKEKNEGGRGACTLLVRYLGGWWPRWCCRWCQRAGGEFDKQRRITAVGWLPMLLSGRSILFYAYLDGCTHAYIIVQRRQHICHSRSFWPQKKIPYFLFILLHSTSSPPGRGVYELFSSSLTGCGLFLYLFIVQPPKCRRKRKEKNELYKSCAQPSPLTLRKWRKEGLLFFNCSPWKRKRRNRIEYHMPLRLGCKKQVAGQGWLG